MKPLFGTAMTTRMGAAIGKGLERVMLQSVGGGSGIRKAYRHNPDGSVTMLATRGGMPEFSQPFATASSGAHIVSVSDSFATVSDGNGRNIVTLSAASATPLILPFSIAGVVGIAGVDYPMAGASADSVTLLPSGDYISAIAGTDYDTPPDDFDFTNGVTISGGDITIPAGVTSFTAKVNWVFDVTDFCKVYVMTVGTKTGYGYYARAFI